MVLMTLFSRLGGRRCGADEPPVGRGVERLPQEGERLSISRWGLVSWRPELTNRDRSFRNGPWRARGRTWRSRPRTPRSPERTRVQPERTRVQPGRNFERRGASSGARGARRTARETQRSARGTRDRGVATSADGTAAGAGTRSPARVKLPREALEPAARAPNVVSRIWKLRSAILSRKRSRTLPCRCRAGRWRQRRSAPRRQHRPHPEHPRRKPRPWPISKFPLPRLPSPRSQHRREAPQPLQP